MSTAPSSPPASSHSQVPASSLAAEPALAPPGAGLPKVELVVARLLFAATRLTGDRAAFTARFQRERAAIAALVDSCPPDRASNRVLIRRPPGLEDSSRNWSVWMTLDHLRIVNSQVAGVIESLVRGIVPARVASTAAVKPAVDVTPAVRADYERSCDALLAAVAAHPNLKATARFAHPWFGPLDAAGWHALAGTHLGIHRVQLERILAGGIGA